MPFILWLIEQSAAAAMGYYVGRYLSSTPDASAKAVAAQKKAAIAAAKARSLSGVTEGEWDEILPETWAVEEFY